jgi:hypothetical protein
MLKIMLCFTMFSLLLLNLVKHPCPMQLLSTKDDFDGWAGWITKFHDLDDLQFVQFTLLPMFLMLQIIRSQEMCFTSEANQ